LTAARVAGIRTRLQSALGTTSVSVRDDSALHVGHPGAQDGGGHFSVEVESGAFTGLSQIRRHQLVYAAVADMIPAEIHALSIKAKAPGER